MLIRGEVFERGGEGGSKKVCMDENGFFCGV